MKGMNKEGIWFWAGAGAGIYSLINMFFNYTRVDQSKVLNYNIIIFGAAIVGLIYNLIMMKKH